MDSAGHRKNNSRIHDSQISEKNWLYQKKGKCKYHVYLIRIYICIEFQGFIYKTSDSSIYLVVYSFTILHFPAERNCKAAWWKTACQLSSNNCGIRQPSADVYWWISARWTNLPSTLLVIYVFVDIDIHSHQYCYFLSFF